jgi:hypothetical protein
MRGETYVDAQRDRRSTLIKHRVVAPYETCKAIMQRVLQRYPCFVGHLHIELDSWLEVDHINVATSVTRGKRLVSLLWHQGAPLVFAEWNDTLWLRR